MSRKWFWLVGLLCLGMVFFQAQATTPQDPLISLSYLELRLNTLREEVKSWIQEAMESANTPQTPTEPTTPGEPLPETPGTDPVVVPTPEPTPTWEVISMKVGETLIAEGGCEIILRAGKAYAIASINGGIANLTQGVDLTTGKEIPTNHLLLVPRSDGRGMKILDLSYLMIKGKYTIQATP